MKIYSESDVEALRARGLLKDWAGEGFITEAQYQRMERETGCELRRTNIFLRAILFLFTVVVVAAAAALFFAVLLPRSTSQPAAAFLLLFALIAYAGAEFAVSKANLYRYGIEEALAVSSVAFLCVGMSASFGRPNPMAFLIPAAGALASLWICHRFGYHYAFVAAAIFVIFLPGHWTSSYPAHYLFISTIYATGLIATARARDGKYSVAEAILWLALYLETNLKFSPLNLLLHWGFGFRSTAELPETFYWITWVLTWCLPPAVLARGLRQKNRPVIAVGAITATLTLITNKLYLNWPRHTWDPMLLGALLIAVALYLHRWLSRGPGGIRHGFTARRISGNDKHWLDASSAAFGLAIPHATTSAPPTSTPEVHFGGGDSAGGGATSDF